MEENNLTCFDCACFEPLLDGGGICKAISPLGAGYITAKWARSHRCTVAFRPKDAGENNLSTVEKE
jgi:hypothetical protein